MIGSVTSYDRLCIQPYNLFSTCLLSTLSSSICSGYWGNDKSSCPQAAYSLEKETKMLVSGYVHCGVKISGSQTYVHIRRTWRAVPHLRGVKIPILGPKAQNLIQEIWAEVQEYKFLHSEPVIKIKV